MSKKLIAPPDGVIITKDERLINKWVKGEAPGYITFYAKMFDEGSQFGIDGGRVSKLQIRKGEKLIANYDRGWDIKPKGAEHKAVYKQVMAALNALGKETERGVTKRRDLLGAIEANKEKAGGAAETAPGKDKKPKGDEIC